MSNTPSGPLAGLRVLELATLYAAPQVGAMLGDLGADVVKVEPPDGDPMRRMGVTRDGVSRSWLWVGRNKRSVALDLDDDTDAATFRRLVAAADVLVENLPAALRERWSCTYDELHAHDPHLVVVSVTGYGLTGPYADRPGAGTLAEAFGGLTHMTGDADGPPMLPSVAIGDTLTAFSGVIGALAACWGRDAGEAQQGRHVDVSMYEPILHVMGGTIASYDTAGEPPSRAGSRVHGGVPRNVYRTLDDRYVAVSGTTDDQVARVLALIGRDTSADHERYGTSAARLRVADELDALVADWVAAHDRDTVVQQLLDARVPVAPVNDVRDVVTDPHVIARASVTDGLAAPLPRMTDARARACTGTGSRRGHRVRDRGVVRLASSPVKVLALVAGLALVTVASPALAGQSGGAPPVPELDAGSASLSEGGQALAATVDLSAAPRYGLRADLKPRSGKLEGSVRVVLPPAARDHLVFRVFAGIVEPSANLRVTGVRVNGDDVEHDLTAGRLVLPPPRSEGRVDVRLRFSYTIPAAQETDPLEALGEGLDPGAIGLLARHGDVVTLGHWFPVWLPSGTATEPDPQGYGDIGNFPAAIIRAELHVPSGWQVLGSGTETSSDERDGEAVVVDEGVGLRDLSFVVGRDLASIETKAGDVTIRVTAPTAQRDSLEAAATEAATSLTLFSQQLTPYPWAELDVIAVPLGGSVGGMEWPGAIWVGANLMAGGFPGLEDLPLPDLDGGGEEGGGPLEDLLELLEGFGLGADTREFTIAHEIAHQWWHTLVGNDSISAPVIDEPLAQHSACLELRARSTTADCTPYIDLQYQTMRSFGTADAPADQASDEFASSLQYGGVVYGKAPGFYRALETLLGADAVAAGLRAFATAQAWQQAGTDDLLGALKGVAPDRAAEIDALWVHWMEEVHGDEDLGTATTNTPGSPVLDQQQLEELIRQLTELEALFPSTTEPAGSPSSDR